MLYTEVTIGVRARQRRAGLGESSGFILMICIGVTVGGHAAPPGVS